MESTMDHIQRAIQFAETKRLNSKVMKLTKNKLLTLSETDRMATGNHPKTYTPREVPAPVSIKARMTGEPFDYSTGKLDKFGKSLAVRFCLSVKEGVFEKQGVVGLMIDQIKKPYVAVVLLSCSGLGEIHASKKNSFKPKLMAVIGGRQWEETIIDENLRYLTLNKDSMDKEWLEKGMGIVKCCCHKEDYHASPVAIVTKIDTLREFTCNHCGALSMKINSCSVCKNAWYCGRECQTRDWEKHKAICIPNNAKPEKICGNCGVTGATYKCSKCKKMYYCTATCQRTHWVLHKKECV